MLIVTELSLTRIDDASLVREIQMHVINAVDVPPEPTPVIKLPMKE